MPKMSGYEVCRVLRTTYQEQDLPVILFTAKNAPGDLEIGFMVGASDYISKPFPRQELISRVGFHLKLSSNVKKLGQVVEELRELNENLEQKVEERTHDLSAAMVELEATNDSLMSINHELEEAHRIAASDMKMAVNVQRSVLPFEAPQTDEWDIAYLFRPMSDISGDFYDFYIIVGKFLGMGLFDISGHGISSGLVTMITKSIIFRNFRDKQNGPLGSVFKSANIDIFQEVGGSHYYTTGCLVCFGDNNTIEYINSAHPDACLKSKKSTGPLRKEDGLMCAGAMIGLFNTDLEFESVRCTVESGDYLLLYTDCLSESFNKEKEMYDEKRIIKIFAEAPDGSAQEVLDYIINDFYSFVADRDKLHDDLTVIVARRK